MKRRPGGYSRHGLGFEGLGARIRLLMRVTVFVTSLLMVAVSSVALVNAQDTEIPVFRSDTNAVFFEFHGYKQKRGGEKQPMTTLTIRDMKVVIDRKEYPPTTMTQDRPGHYVLSLTIPDAYKDGKTHKVMFKVKRSTFPFTRPITIPKAQDLSPF